MGRIAVAVLLLATACTTSARVGDSAEPADPPPTPTAAPTVAASPEPRVAATATPVPTPPPTSTAVPTATPQPTPTTTPQPIGAVMDDAFAASRLEPRECNSVPAVTCWTAIVPLRHRTPEDGDTVDLAVVTIDNGDPLGIGPVVFLQGGPGIGTLGRAGTFVGISFDVVLVDQRGTGLSMPNLACPEVDEIWELERTDDETVRIEEEDSFAAYEACAERLRSEGIDLDAFHTDAVAADAELIRRLLDHEQWSIWGISYGTRVGLTAMRDHPDGIRAAVLDSVVPFEVDFLATLPENGLRAFEALDAACDRTTCAERHGDFESILADLARRLDEEPVVVTARRAQGGGTIDYRVTGAELLDFVFTQLYSTRDLTALPRQISRADAGGLQEIVAGYVRSRDPLRLDLSVGVYYSTWCREEFPYHDPTRDDALIAEAAERYGDAFEDALSAEVIGRLCGYFDVEPGPPILDEPLTSSIPTLVFAGAFDPITPPEWSRQVADALTNSTYVEMPNHGHGMSTPCPGGLLLEFLRAPDEELDTSCVEQTGDPAFE